VIVKPYFVSSLKWCHFNGDVFFLNLTVRGREREGEWVEGKEDNEEATIKEEEKEGEEG